MLNSINPPFEDGIYYFKKENNKLIPIRCTLFNENELTQISFSVLILKRLFKNLNRSSAVGEAYDEFLEETRRPEGKNVYEVERVDRRFRSFIYEWSLYTEHWKNYILDLDESVWSDGFINGFKKLFNQFMTGAYKSPDFVIAHILRNYISHANDAIDKSHIDGKNNVYCIYRATLELFLHNTISRSHGNRKNQLQNQMAILKEQNELIDLVNVADNAMKWIRKCESSFMDYQIEPQLLQACNILSQARQRIDESGIGSDVWELWTQQPLFIDHQHFESVTFEGTIDGKQVDYTYYTNRLNWIGCGAIVAYINNVVNGRKNDQTK